VRLRILVSLGCGEMKYIQNFGGKSSLKGYWKTEQGQNYTNMSLFEVRWKGQVDVCS
jgi:hypothetical protein